VTLVAICFVDSRWDISWDSFEQQGRLHIRGLPVVVGIVFCWFFFVPHILPKKRAAD